MKGTATSLTAIAVSVCVSLAVSTPVRCPHGHWLWDRAGAWTVNVQPIPDRRLHNGRGDVAQCKCVVCRGRFYHVVTYPKVAR